MRSSLWQGYWSPACESWFQSHLTTISEQCASLKSSKQWTKEISRYHKQSRNFLKPHRNAACEFLLGGGTRCCSLVFLCPGLLYTYALPTCSKPPHKFRIFDCFKCCRISIFLFIRDSCRRIRLQQIHSCGTSSMTIRTQLLLHLCRVI